MLTLYVQHLCQYGGLSTDTVSPTELVSHFSESDLGFKHTHFSVLRVIANQVLGGIFIVMLFPISLEPFE